MNILKSSGAKICLALILALLSFIGCAKREYNLGINQFVDKQGRKHGIRLTDVLIHPQRVVAIHYWNPSSASGLEAAHFTEYSLFWSYGESWQDIPLPLSGWYAYFQLDWRSIIVIGIQGILKIDLKTKQQQYLWIHPWNLIYAITAIDVNRKYVAFRSNDSFNDEKMLKIIRLADGHVWSAISSAMPTGMIFNGEDLLVSVPPHIWKFQIGDDSSPDLIASTLLFEISKDESIVGAIDEIPVMLDDSNTSLRLGDIRVPLNKSAKQVTIISNNVLAVLEDGSIVSVGNNGQVKVVGKISMDNIIGFGNNCDGLWIAYSDWHICIVSSDGKSKVVQFPSWKPSDSK
jgi:hypothetical protein